MKLSRLGFNICGRGGNGTDFRKKEKIKEMKNLKKTTERIRYNK